ncbi:twitching motility protein PilJ [Clostridium sp. CAG:411]|jgi:methyl-accepting chemotaxis protein|nr:methyl-accepting chemotaxis protein [Lachnospiraceae bacterium]CDE45301.1 twitching motility protein PilJ [Clostridium sp. CAG:411]
MTEETGVRETKELVKEGLEGTEKLAQKNNNLNELMQKTSANVEQMEKLTNMIEGFAGVIAGIANKTNMLALNASIEAARAGEHGRGFAVVAKQVGELAAQSATSSKEIKETIQSVQGFTNEMVASMEQLSKAIEEQSQITANVSEVLGEIKNGIQ